MGNTKELQQGPYKRTLTKTIELAPIKFTTTEVEESTHVPPAPCGCGGGGGLIDAIMQAAQAAGIGLGGSMGATPIVEQPTPDDPDEH